MIKTLSFRRVLGLGFAVLFAQAVSANEGLTQEEAIRCLNILHPR